MKMANLDAVFSFVITDSKDECQTELFHLKREMFYFADICAGPGGFAEYILWRKGYPSHGFGLTLKGKDDFRLEKFLASSPELFEPFYGEGGVDGNGDITSSANLRAFRQFVMTATAGHNGVSLVTADGGFSVEGKENLQEILSRRLYICQACCALSILRPNGNFVCKLFDTLTAFSVGLLYLLWRSFDRVCLHKPKTSRPANSEKYVVCIGYRDNSNVWKYLLEANARFDEVAKEECKDIVQLVPPEVLQEDPAFLNYIRSMNETFASRQTYYLQKYKVFAQNITLEDYRQSDLRARCLAYWKIPELPRPPPPRPSPNMKFQEICGPEDPQWVMSQGTPFQLSKFSPRLFLTCSRKPVLIIALGNTFIFQYEDGRWQDPRAKDYIRFTLQIPRDSLLIADMTYEYRGEGKTKQQRKILRILDCFCLGGLNVSTLPYMERMHRAKLFCNSISKQHSRSDLAMVVTAETMDYAQVFQSLSRFRVEKMHGQHVIVMDNYPNNGYIIVDYLISFQILKGIL
ncbi:unnamed protein product [Soboliphyme baturini]|uniref:Cap-specific mRNA (nucleoside-2'-O-)-methyltransferase 1 n=1 Tax=Soboliphyme baturini TaxID=241478 RepID=A0A183IU23_9BILA|nr:unnamed protein product [Soboliphyme baturini]